MAKIEYATSLPSALVREFTKNIAETSHQRAGYPAIANRLRLGDVAIDNQHHTVTIDPEAEHRALASSPDRRKVPGHLLDPEIPRPGHDYAPRARTVAWRNEGYYTTNRGLPVHPYALVMLGSSVGMPVGIGQFRRHGRQDMVDGFWYRMQDSEPEALLAERRPEHSQADDQSRKGNVWGTIGGFVEEQDQQGARSPEHALLRAASRKLLEKTGIIVQPKTSKTLTRRIPFSTPTTLTSWAETTAVLPLGYDAQALGDAVFTPNVTMGVTDVDWFSLPAIEQLAKDGRVWPDHLRYLRAGFAHLKH